MNTLERLLVFTVAAVLLFLGLMALAPVVHCEGNSCAAAYCSEQMPCPGPCGCALSKTGMGRCVGG